MLLSVLFSYHRFFFSNTNQDLLQTSDEHGEMHLHQTMVSILVVLNLCET